MCYLIKSIFFSNLAEFVEKKLTVKEKVDIAYININCCGVFKKSLQDWKKKSKADKTYNNFKTFMRDEHVALDQVNALSKNDSSLNHVEFLAQQEAILT